MFGWSLAKVERERDDYAKRWVAANDEACRLRSTVAGLQQAMQQTNANYAALEHRFNALNDRYRDVRDMLSRAREANSKYFMECAGLTERNKFAVTVIDALQRRLGRRAELVVLDCGIYTDGTGRERHAWSVWLDGVRLYTTSVLCDWAEQPERLWLTVEALERALGVKAMKATAKGRFDPEGAGGGPRKLTPVWLPGGMPYPWASDDNPHPFRKPLPSGDR